MDRPISAANQAALEARALMARDFLTIVGREPGTTTPAPFFFWSDAGTVTANVIDPDTGGPEQRPFYGAFGMVAIGDIPLVSNLTVQTVSIVMSQIDPVVEDMIRGCELNQARVEIHRGLFSIESRRLVAAALPRFVGFVDEVQVTTPAENEEGAAVLTCTSHTQELTRSNPDTRSHESQILRSPTDNFFQDASTVGDWEMFWGKKNGKLTTAGRLRLRNP